MDQKPEKDESDFPPHVQRMIDEWKELKKKTTDLSSFILKNPIFLNLEEVDRQLMRTQLDAMYIYSRTLVQRLNRVGLKINCAA